MAFLFLKSKLFRHVTKLIITVLTVQGFASTKWAGRCEWKEVEGVGKVLIDGAHNEPATLELRKYVDRAVTQVGATKVTVLQRFLKMFRFFGFWALPKEKTLT
jgi:folylpolyglutamate synthase/dihydropteroate synthase